VTPTVLVFDVNETLLDITAPEPVFAQMFGDVHGVRIVDDDLHAVRTGFANLPAHPDVAAGLGQLRDKGHRLVTLTNSPTSSGGETQLQRAGFSHFFEPEFSVDAARVYKPAPELYRNVATQLGVAPSDCMMVRRPQGSAGP
jgi:2-haloacid dehalogenase